MGLFDRFWSRRSAPLVNLSQWFASLGEIRERKALGQPAVWSAVNLIVGDLSSMPINVYDRQPDGGRIKLDLTAKAYLPWMLRFQPNPYQTTPVFLGKVVYDVLLKKGAFILKAHNVVGEVVQMHPVHPELVTVEWDGRKKWFKFDGALLSDKEMIHIPPIVSEDGINGLSLLDVCNRTLSGAVALDEFSGAYFKNAAIPSGILTTDAGLKEDARKKAQADWEAQYSGPSNQNRIAVITGTWKYQSVASNAQDAQLVEAKQFTVSDVARLFRIPPYKLGDTTKVSYSSIEAQQMEYWQSCLRPIAVRIEAAFNAGLVSEQLQAVRYVEFDYTSVVKPDSRAMSELVAQQVKDGLISPNEGRAKLNLPPVSGGDFLLVAQNMSKLEGGEINPLNIDGQGVGISPADYGDGVRAGLITPQIEDERAYRERMELPPMTAEAEASWDESGGTRHPITLTKNMKSGDTPPGGQSVSPDPQPQEATK